MKTACQFLNKKKPSLISLPSLSELILPGKIVIRRFKRNPHTVSITTRMIFKRKESSMKKVRKGEDGLSIYELPKIRLKSVDDHGDDKKAKKKQTQGYIITILMVRSYLN